MQVKRTPSMARRGCMTRGVHPASPMLLKAGRTAWLGDPNTPVVDSKTDDSSVARPLRNCYTRAKLIQPTPRARLGTGYKIANRSLVFVRADLACSTVVCLPIP
jgi:hypothetical protein